jgi:polysaccharide deacetylase family protein (PEP-CTERM system associated)
VTESIGLIHALTVDIEDWNNAALLWVSGRIVPPTDDVVRNTERLLALLEEGGARATCFVLGEIAECFPQLIQRIASGGHELGVHGWHHHRLHELTRDAFRGYIVRAKALVEDITGTPVLGYRAVAMSLTRETAWAYDAVEEAGFHYSSSIFPARGLRHACLCPSIGPHRVNLANGKRFLEIPLTVVDLAGVRVPACGGGYLRHFPLGFTRWAIGRLEKEGRRAVVYLHPYELDLGKELHGIPEDLCPKDLQKMQSLRWGQFRNRAQTTAKVKYLLENHRFAPIRETFHHEIEVGEKGGAIGG